jgi:hypothetical protein
MPVRPRRERRSAAPWTPAIHLTAREQVIRDLTAVQFAVQVLAEVVTEVIDALRDALAAALVSVPGTRQATGAGALGKRAQRSIRVLVVEDNHVNQASRCCSWVGSARPRTSRPTVWRRSPPWSASPMT